MKFLASATIAMALMAINGISASNPSTTGVPARVVITVRPAPVALEPDNLTVSQGNLPAHVVRLQRLSGDLADMQLFVLLDDSSRSASLGVQLQELKKFVASLPSTTQVAVGYMRNGTFGLAQSFTADHQKAAGAMRPSMAIPGENASPYFVLSDLAKHWPSKEATGRRAVLMLTDGVDPYYGSAVMDDPYVDAAIRDVLKQGLMVYSVYLRGAGRYGQNTWVTTIAQSRLDQVCQETGGHAYFQGLTDPVSVSPFLNDFEDRLANQYQVTVEVLNEKGVRPVKIHTDLPGLKLEGPTRVYVQ
jgi:hypothetical protein